jgi:NTP pyrophosphatase (non-canonical NTP hydrolase)
MTAIEEMQGHVVQWAEEKGWFEDKRTFVEACMLGVTEFSEATDAYRDYGMDGPLFEYNGGLGKYTTKSSENEEWTRGKPVHVGSELADVLIRLLEMCHRFDIDIVKEFDIKMAYNETRPYRHGGRRL